VVRTEWSPAGNAAGSRDVLPVHRHAEQSAFERPSWRAIVAAVLDEASNRGGGEGRQAQGSIERRLLETEAGATSPVLEESLETRVACTASAMERRMGGEG
jgi:hypothetical protein